MLVKVLMAHIVPRPWTAEALRDAADSDGMANRQTVSGDALTVRMRSSGDVSVFGEPGNACDVTIPDGVQSNGAIHVVDGLLPPR